MKRILLVSLSLLLILSLSSCSLLGLDFSDPAGTGSQRSDEPVYTITYDLGDGSEIKVTYRSSDPDYVPETPEKDGYSFSGWTIDGKDGLYNGIVKSGSSGDITFHAVWELITYTISYENVGTNDNPATYTVESESFALSEPSAPQAGYYFVGWQSEDGQLQKNVTIAKGSTGNRVFRAVWSATPFTFEAGSDLEGADVTTNIGDDLLKTGTQIRVSANVYVGEKMFSYWEANGSKVSESALYSFPMPGKNLVLNAVYVDIPRVTYDKATGKSLTISKILSATPTVFAGGGIDADGFTLTSDGVTLLNTYLQTLSTGSYRFYIASVQDDAVAEDTTFTLVVSDTSAASTASTVSYTGNAKTYYEKPTFEYGGKTYHRVATTEEEFRMMVEYFVFVEGVLQMQANYSTSKEFTFSFYLFGDLNEYAERVTDISFPMRPKISYKSSKSGSEKGATITLSVQYQDGLNSEVSSQALNPIEDRQKLLSASNRSEDYDAFPIESLTATASVRTIYELELLPYGYKPVFADNATDAKTVYEAAKSVLRTIISDGMDDYAKVAAIYAWLGENVTYDQIAFSSESSAYSAYTVKGALIDRIAVCDGYASALRLLCQIEGIRAEEVTGLCLQQGSLSGHAWSKVWIGGAVYGVDSTWARPLGSDFVTMRYLFMDEAALFETQHYENASTAAEDPTASRVKVLADASIDNYTALVIDTSGHDYSISSKAEFEALVDYLEENKIEAAEFILADSDLKLYSSKTYTVYTTTGSDICFIEFD